nr:hypothetical protein [Actinoplanes globisporus]
MPRAASAGIARVLLFLFGDQPVAHEHPMRCRPGRRRLEQLLGGDLVNDAPRAPPRMLLTQLADQRLDRR